MNREDWSSTGTEILSRKELKKYMQRNNSTGASRFILHLSLIFLTGYLLSISMNTWWCIPLMVMQGTLIAFLFAPMHEACHSSAFKLRSLNVLVGRIAGLIILRPFFYMKYRHMAHHTFTQHPKMDPDRVAFPRSISEYLLHVSSCNIWHRMLKNLLWLSFGVFSPQEREFIPRNEFSAVANEVRVMVFIYLMVFVISVYFQSWLAVYVWLLPRIIGEPVLRAVRMAEHTGMDETPDMRNNTRTTITNPIVRALYWNMPYHAEHHLFPSVPFHALPQLHKVVGPHLKEVSPGIFDIHFNILGRIRENNRVNPESNGG